MMEKSLEKLKKYGATPRRRIRNTRYLSLILLVISLVAVGFLSASSFQIMASSIVWLSLLTFTVTLFLDFIFCSYSRSILLIAAALFWGPWILLAALNVGSGYGTAAAFGVYFLFICVPCNLFSVGLLLYMDMCYRSN